MLEARREGADANMSDAAHVPGSQPKSLNLI